MAVLQLVAEKMPKQAPPAPSATPASQLDQLLRDAEATARKAKGSNKSLRGDNSYADNFHTSQTNVLRAIRELKAQLELTADAGLLRTIADVEKQVSFFFEPKTSDYDRRELRRQICLVVGSQLEPALKTLDH